MALQSYIYSPIDKAYLYDLFTLHYTETAFTAVSGHTFSIAFLSRQRSNQCMRFHIILRGRSAPRKIRARGTCPTRKDFLGGAKVTSEFIGTGCVAESELGMLFFTCYSPIILRKEDAK